MREKIVVLLPTFKESDYIENCLNSLAVQRDSVPTSEFVVLMIDRQVQDGTREAARKAARRLDLDLRILDDRTGSMSGARSQGVRFARSQLAPTAFLSVDADTVLPSGWLSSALGLLRDGGYALVAGEGSFAVDFWRSVPRLAAGYAANVGSVFFPREIYAAHRRDTPIFDSVYTRFGRAPSDCAMLVDSTCLLAVGDIPRELDESGELQQGVGWPLMVRLLANGESITSLPFPRYETSARRLIGDAAGLLDSSTYRTDTYAFREDDRELRDALDGLATDLDWDDLRRYVVRNYVVLPCLIKPRLIEENLDFFGAVADQLDAFVQDERNRGNHKIPSSAFGASRRIARHLHVPIVNCFNRERGGDGRL